MADHRRASDRWVTPGVVCTFLLIVGVLVLATIAAVTYLQAQGRDPEPMLKLVGQAVTAAGAAGSFVLQLVGRSTVTKVERNVNELTTAHVQVRDALWEVADRVDGLEAGQAGQAGQAGPEPAADHPPLEPVTQVYETAPAAPGSVGQDGSTRGPVRGPSVPGR